MWPRIISKHLTVLVGPDLARDLPFGFVVGFGYRPSSEEGMIAHRIWLGASWGRTMDGEFWFVPEFIVSPAWKDAGIEPLTQ